MMTVDKILLPVLASLSVAFSLPGAAVAQQRGVQAQRAENVKATADMRARIAAADERVVATQRRGKITPARAAELRRQIANTGQSMTRLSRQKGFVSAAELASYDRTLTVVDAELRRSAGQQSYGNDMLPSAQMTAFERTDARLHYRNARIEYDARNCAVYQGTAPNGRTLREPLRDPGGRPICTRR